MLYYIIPGVSVLIALWIVVAGFISFRTKQITIFIGNKSFEFEGRKAILAGACSIIVGLGSAGYAIFSIYRYYVSTQFN